MVMIKSSRINSTILFLLFLSIFALAFGFQGSRGIWQPDEGYYVGATLTMLRNGDLMIPRLGEEGLEIFLEKPPMLYWGIMAGLKAIGHSEFAVRAFNAVCYIATAFVTGLLCFSLFKDKRIAVAAGFMHATMVIPFMAANFITPDTALALWTTAAALCFYKSVEPDGKHIGRWQFLLCIVVGLGFLTKGPAVLIPCGGMFMFLLLRRQVVHFFGAPWALIGLGVFCLVGLGWYVYISTKIPGAAGYIFDNQIWGRLVSDKYRRNPGLTGALIYLPVVTLGALPWSAIWWQEHRTVRRTLLRKEWWANLLQNPQKLFLVCWFFVPMIVLCLASSKLVLYALPLFPVIAIVSARLYGEKILIALENINRNVRAVIKPSVLVAVWIFTLLGMKLAIAYYPTKNDSRHLWKQLSQHIPEENCEIVTVDEHAYGLLFYGATEVENTTMDERPYPTFSATERFSDELRDVGIDNHPFAFVFEKNYDTSQAEKLLKKMNIAYNKKSLPFQRSLLICQYQNSRM